MMELKALKSFRDKTNPEKTYKVGETLGTDDLDRVYDLVSRGICVIVSVGEKKQSANADGSDMIKALADSGVTDLDKEYVAESDKRSIALAAISVLKKMIVLTSDSLGKSSQGYSVEGLEQRIKDLCIDNGLDLSDFVEVSSITDGSNQW